MQTNNSSKKEDHFYFEKNVFIFLLKNERQRNKNTHKKFKNTLKNKLYLHYIR
jgi:hypothetical protein